MTRAERAPRRTDWSANKAPEDYAPTWSTWEAMLDGADHKSILRFEQQPHFGYWRVKVWKAGTSSMEMRKAPHGHEPIAFYPWGDKVICRLGNHTTFDKFEDVCERWFQAKLNDVISFEEYQHWEKTGKWVTTPKGQDADMATVPAPDPDGTIVPMDGSAIVDPPKTHNAPPEETPYTKAVGFIDGKARDIAKWVKAIGKVADEDQLAEAQKHRDILIKTRTSLERVRKEEKAPHIAAGNAIDAKYNDLKAKVEEIERSVNDASRDFAIALDARIKREKAEADRIAAEQARKAREELESAEVSRTICDDAAADKHEAKAAVAIAAASEARAAPAKLAVGSTGRKITVKNVVTAKIEDYGKALAYFQDDDQIKARVQQKADAIIRAGGTVPGCSRDERPDI